MAASRVVREAEAEAEGPQATPRPSTDLSLNHSFDSQVLGFSSFLPSPPSEPPDIRNWFSSYDYDSPDLSGLPFELGSCVGDAAELSGGFGKIRDLRRGEHALCTRERSCSQSPQRPTECPKLEHLLGPKGKDNFFCHLNNGRFVRERINYNHIQTQEGGPSPHGGFVATQLDQRAQNGSTGLSISEHDGGVGESASPETMEIKIIHHKQSEKNIPVESPTEQESLDGRNRGRSDLSFLGTRNSGITCETGSREELLLANGSRGQERDHVIGDGQMPVSHRDNSQENGRYLLPGSWVSTRDYRHPSASKERLLLNGDFILENRKQSRVQGHVPIAIRTALADKANHLNEPSGGTATPEIAGKWQCPRKNKAERGPPLKQLRLECWVRRVD